MACAQRASNSSSDSSERSSPVAFDQAQQRYVQFDPASKNVRLFQANSREMLLEMPSVNAGLFGHWFSPDDRFLGVTGVNVTRVVDLERREVVFELPGRSIAWGPGVSFSGDARRVAIAANDGASVP